MPPGAMPPGAAQAGTYDAPEQAPLRSDWLNTVARGNSGLWADASPDVTWGFGCPGLRWSRRPWSPMRGRGFPERDEPSTETLNEAETLAGRCERHNDGVNGRDDLGAADGLLRSKRGMAVMGVESPSPGPPRTASPSTRRWGRACGASNERTAAPTRGLTGLLLRLGDNPPPGGREPQRTSSRRLICWIASPRTSGGLGRLVRPRTVWSATWPLCHASLIGRWRCSCIRPPRRASRR